MVLKASGEGQEDHIKGKRLVVWDGTGITTEVGKGELVMDGLS